RHPLTRPGRARRVRSVRDLRRQPPGLHQPGARRSRTGLPARTGLRAAARPGRTGAGHLAAPDRVVLRGAGRRPGCGHHPHPGVARGAGARSRSAGPLSGVPDVTSAPDKLLLRLEWRVIRRLDGRLQGAYRTQHRGSGLDFVGVRPYVDGDDARHIDWNVTARLDELQVREFTEDRELTAWLVLDSS